MKNELCYFQTEVKFYEYRKVTRRIRYGGPAVRIKIVKGLYWRAADYGVQVISDDVLMLIDSGNLFLTNKRMIFMGAKGNKVTKLNNILDFNPYSNGIEIQKASGKSPFIEFSQDIDIFTLMLDRVIRDYNR